MPPCPRPTAENPADRNVGTYVYPWSTMDGTIANLPHWAGAPTKVRASGSLLSRPPLFPLAAAVVGGPGSTRGTRTAAATTRPTWRGRRSSATCWANGRCAVGRRSAAASSASAARGTAAAPGWPGSLARAHPTIASIRRGWRWGDRPLLRPHRNMLDCPEVRDCDEHVKQQECGLAYLPSHWTEALPGWHSRSQ